MTDAIDRLQRRQKKWMAYLRAKSIGQINNRRNWSIQNDLMCWLKLKLTLFSTISYGSLKNRSWKCDTESPFCTSVYHISHRPLFIITLLFSLSLLKILHHLSLVINQITWRDIKYQFVNIIWYVVFYLFYPLIFLYVGVKCLTSENLHKRSDKSFAN